ncbi:MAG: nucleotidyltransferase domain-containing protein [Planctomycetes bacterium]|nr:nucleotidyltransferase domain-containing protein [Planctomycetota bacterium]
MLGELECDRLRAALRAGPALRLAMLFGSGASGTLRPESDVDVAILPANPQQSLHEDLALQAALSMACGREVDLVRLDQAVTLLRWQVARHGRPLLAASPAEVSRFVADAASEYLDFAPAFERAAEVFRRRLLTGTGKA